MDETANPGRHILSTQKWLQLGRLAQGFAPYSTVFWDYKQWRETRVLDEIMNKLHGKVREQAQKK